MEPEPDTSTDSSQVWKFTCILSYLHTGHSQHTKATRARVLYLTVILNTAYLTKINLKTIPSS